MTWKNAAGAILLTLVIVAGATRGFAQQPAAQQPSTGQPPSAAQEGYVPADQLPKPQDTLPAAPLLATAYAFVWLLLFGYVFSIWRRLASVEREMQSVSRRIGPTGGRMP